MGNTRQKPSRRSFLRGAPLLATGALAACGQAQQQAAAPADAEAGGGGGGGAQSGAADEYEEQVTYELRCAACGGVVCGKCRRARRP